MSQDCKSGYKSGVDQNTAWPSNVVSRDVLESVFIALVLATFSLANIL